jgi:hypothetical protein
MPNPTPILQEQIRAYRKKLRRDCRALDIPERPCQCPQRAKACGCVGPCDCPGQTLADQFSPPCRCILQREHDYGWDDECEDDQANAERQVRAWARLLLRAFGEDYLEPDPPKRPANALSRGERVRKMQRRCQSGVRLYHPDDPWRKENREKYRVKTLVRVLRNGALDEDEEVAGENSRSEAPPPKWPYAPQPVADSETPRQRARREREDRVNEMLMQLGAAGTFDARGTVDYEAIYEEQPVALPFVAASERRAA